MASEVAKRLRDRRLNVWNDAKKIAEDAAGENSASFTPEEQGRWDAMQEEMGTLDTRIKAVLDTEKRAADADKAYDDLAGKQVDKRGANSPAQQASQERIPPVRPRRGRRPACHGIPARQRRSRPD